MIRRREVRRSCAGIDFLLYLLGGTGWDQARLVPVLRMQLQRVKSFFPALSSRRKTCRVNPASSEGKAPGDVARLFIRAVVMGPPVAPCFEVLAKGCAGDGTQCGVNQVLRRGVEGIVVEKIKQLWNGDEALLTG